MDKNFPLFRLQRGSLKTLLSVSTDITKDNFGVIVVTSTKDYHFFRYPGNNIPLNQYWDVGIESGDRIFLLDFTRSDDPQRSIIFGLTYRDTERLPECPFSCETLQLFPCKGVDAKNNVALIHFNKAYGIQTNETINITENQEIEPSNASFTYSTSIGSTRDPENMCAFAVETGGGGDCFYYSILFGQNHKIPDEDTVSSFRKQFADFVRDHEAELGELKEEFSDVEQSETDIDLIIQQIETPGVNSGGDFEAMFLSRFINCRICIWQLSGVDKNKIFLSDFRIYNPDTSDTRWPCISILKLNDKIDGSNGHYQALVSNMKFNSIKCKDWRYQTVLEKTRTNIATHSFIAFDKRFIEGVKTDDLI